MTGRTETRGSRYAVSVEAFEPAAGNLIAAATHEFGRMTELTDAVRRVMMDLQRGLSRSAQSLRAPPERLQPATTSSLQALRLYSRAYDLGVLGQWTAAKELVRQALEEDPSFATAHVWLAWCEQNTGNRDGAKAAAARAVALTPTVQVAERYWIEGSHAMMAGEDGRAIAAFEALLGVQPDHDWAARNLYLAHLRKGRWPDALPAVLRQADRFPDRIRFNMLAAELLLASTGDFDRASVYAGRITGAVEREPAVADLFGGEISWALLLPVVQRASAGSADGVLDALTNLRSGVILPRGTARDLAMNNVSLAYLSIGRIAEAHAAAAQIDQPDSRYIAAALVAWWGGDHRSLREFVQQVRPSVWLAQGLGNQLLIAAWLLSEGGRIADAERLVPLLEAKTGAPGVALLRGDLAMWRGDLAGASKFLEEAVRIMPLRIGPYYRAVDRLADACIQRGDRRRAMAVLQDALARPVHAGQISGITYRLLVQVRLVELLAATGQSREAGKLRHEIERMLAHADPDLPLLRRVRGQPAREKPGGAGESGSR